jgi:hypothetical protein
MSPAALGLLLLALAQTGATPYVRSRAQEDAKYSPPACLYWTAPRLAFQQSQAGNPATTGESEFTAVSRSFQTWADVFSLCGNLQLSEGARVAERQTGYVSGGTNHNLVLFRTKTCEQAAPQSSTCWQDGSCANTFDCWDFDDETIGITIVSYDVRTGVIYDADIELNAAQFEFTTVDAPACVGSVSSQSCVSTDVQNTVTHEVGHFLGLDHSSATGSVMAPDARTGETSKRRLDSASEAFVCEVYPRGKASVSCVPRLPVDAPSGEADEDGGCASAGTGALLLPLLALLPALRRRRRGA